MYLPPFTIKDLVPKKEGLRELVVKEHTDYSLAVTTIPGLSDELLNTYIPIMESSTIEAVSL